MNQTRIYLPLEIIKEKLIIEDKEIVHKFKNILRLKEKGIFFVFDGQGKEYSYSLDSLNSKKISALQIKKERVQPQMLPLITLAVPLVKEERLKFIFQKATELGVNKFIPFICERSLSEKPSENKINRWEKIVIEAVRQSDRLWIPKIETSQYFETLLNYPTDAKFIGVINGKRLKTLPGETPKEILMLIGPEGDFSLAEIKKAVDSNFFPLTFASTTLRVETAAAFSVGLLRYLYNIRNIDYET